MHKLKAKELDASKYFDVDSLKKVYNLGGVQYLGMQATPTKSNVLSEEDKNIFLEACRIVIESDIFEGLLAPPTIMELLAYDTKRKVIVNTDGTKAILCPKDTDDKTISKEEDIEYRSFLFLYFKSKIGREELNERFGKMFYREGELPNKL